MVGGRSLSAVVVAVVLGICGTCVAAAPALRNFAAPPVANPQRRSLTLDVGDPPVPAGFSSVGEALQSCEFVSTEESPFKFNFNLDLLSQNIQNAAAPNRVVYENPVRSGHCLTPAAVSAWGRCGDSRPCVGVVASLATYWCTMQARAMH